MPLGRKEDPGGERFGTTGHIFAEFSLRFNIRIDTLKKHRLHFQVVFMVYPVFYPVGLRKLQAVSSLREAAPSRHNKQHSNGAIMCLR